MLRVPCRYLLPLLVLALTIALILIGRQQQRGIEIGNWDGPPPRPVEIAAALNVPAVMAALPGGILLEFATSGFSGKARKKWHESFGAIYFSVFEVGQWFLIGRWLDRRRGILPSPSVQILPNVSRAVYVVALLGSFCFVLTGIVLIVRNDSWIPGAGTTLWSLIAMIALAFRLRRSRSPQGPGSPA